MAKSKDKAEPKTKEESLELAIDSLQKDFGKGIIISGSFSHFPEVGRIPSGSISLDKALGGAWARGRLIELLGAESAGKTTIALHAIAECQKLGGKCAFIDAEHALDIYYAANLGVDTESLMICQPDCGEQALNVAERLARSGAVELVIIDSVAALVPRVELEGEIGDAHVGLQARLMSQAMRMLAGVTARNNTAIIFINQIRSKIGISFGNPEVASGGNALKYYTSQRVDLRRIETIKVGTDKTAIRVRAKVIKNKVGPPFRQAEFNIIFGKGIDWANDVLTQGVELGIIEKSGAWFSYNGKQLGQGTANAGLVIEQDLHLAEELRRLILNPDLKEAKDEISTSD